MALPPISTSTVETTWLLGHAAALRRDPLGSLRALGREGDLVPMRLGPLRALLVLKPDDIKRVLQDNQKNYTKRTIAYARMREALGDGLVTSEGDLWLRQRRIAQPAFHRAQIQAFAGSMVRQAEALVGSWRARDGRPLDVAAEMQRLTQLIVGETLLGADVSDRAEVAGRCFDQLSAALMDRTSRFFPLPLWVPFGSAGRLARARRTLNQLVDDLIAQRRARGGESGDLLTLLMNARDEQTGEGMNDRQLRAEVMTMYLAGHETTATALTWAWYLLALHPDAEARLHDELARVLGGRAPGTADLDKLPFTRMVIDETMRLYPPVWAMSRAAAAADQLGEVAVRAGTQVFLSPWVTHRLPSLWERPDEFDPERFTPERVAARPRFAYFPFLGGPRQCIGNSFALMEAQLILATVAQRYRLALACAPDVTLLPLLTLRPKHGLPMRLEPRAPG